MAKDDQDGDRAWWAKDGAEQPDDDGEEAAAQSVHSGADDEDEGAEHDDDEEAVAEHDDDEVAEVDDQGDYGDEPGKELGVPDPYWWTPYLVLGILLLIGLLGFLGVFNRLFGIEGRASSSESATRTAEARAPSGEAPARPSRVQAKRYGARHILVQYKGSRLAGASITRTKAEAKARASEARNKLKAGGKFEQLVVEYSDEPGAAERKGDLGKFRRGTMVPPFQTALEKLEVGERSGVVETPFGFHVIERTL